MAVIKKIREAMIHNEEKRKGIRNSLLMLMLEWKNFEGDLDIAAKCLRECLNELEAKEKHFTSVQESITESYKELELIRESVEKKEEEFCAFREREIRDLECKLEEFSLAQKEFDGVVKLREEKMSEQDKMVENRLREIDEIRSWIGEETDGLHLKERKFMERVAEFEVKEKRLLSMEKEMENKERVLDSARKELMVKESCLDNVKKELRMKETELLSVKKELKIKDESMDAIKKKLELKENELSSFKERLELREEELSSIKKEYRQRLEELDCKEKGLDLVVVATRKCDGEFQVEKENFRKEQGLFKKRMEDVAHREKWAEVRCIELKQREKHIDNQFKLLEEKEKQLKAISSDPVEAEPIDYVKVDRVGAIVHLEKSRQEADATCPSHTKEALTSCISKAPTGGLRHSDDFANILVGMGGKNLQSFLTDHWEEHELLRVEVSRALKVADDSRMFVLEALEGFYPAEPHEEEVKCNRNIIRKSCILLLEELMRISPVRTPKAKLKASKLASNWKAKMMAEAENHLPILGFLYLVGAYGLASAYDKNELESLCAAVSQHGQVNQIFHALDISVINGEPLSRNVDKRNKQQKGSILRSSLDPAKIVLDALRKCYYVELENSKKRYRDKLIVMKSFPDLLEQLREVSPEIRPQVKIEANEFAVTWRAAFIGSCWQVIGLFNFLATFELSSLFDSDDLLGLLERVWHIHWPINVINILGIADKIPCFIEKLIRRREWLQALVYIYEFKLGGLFPPMPLLKNYVAHEAEQANQIRGKGAIEKAIFCELSALRAAIEHIVLHNLQFEYSPDPLEARASELEGEMANFSAANQPISQAQKTVEEPKNKQQKV